MPLNIKDEEVHRKAKQLPSATGRSITRAVGEAIDEKLARLQAAEKLGTRRSTISRLESLSSDVSPRLSTMQDYARVLGYSMHIEFERAQ